MAVGVGIFIQQWWFSHFVFSLKASDHHAKVSELWLFHQCADTSVAGYHPAPTHYRSVNTMLLQSYSFEKRHSPFPSVTLVWGCGQMGYGLDLSWQQDCYLAISLSKSAALLYCSSMPLLALLCIWAKIRFFWMYPLWNFEQVQYYCFLSPGMKMAPFVEITNSIMGDTMLLSILQAFTDSSLSSQYRPMLLCALVHFMCMAVFRPFTDSSLNPQYRLMLLVHLCTLCAPSESSLNQLKCCWLCKYVRSVFLSVGQKAASSISLQKSLWNSPGTLHIF